MNCDRSSFASAWANIGRSADSTWTQEPLDLYTRANQQLWVRHCRLERSDCPQPDLLSRDFISNQSSGLPSRVASELTSRLEAHTASGATSGACRERDHTSDGEVEQAASEDGNTECWMLPEVEYWFSKLISPSGADGSPRPQLCTREHELSEAAEISSTQTPSSKLSQTELSALMMQPFNDNITADVWQDNESICSGAKAGAHSTSVGDYDDLYFRHVIACGMQADPPPRCSVRSADERRLASRVRCARSLWAARTPHGKLRAHAPPRAAAPPARPTSLRRIQHHRPPESYTAKQQPLVQGPSSRSSCGSGVDFNNLIFLTNSQRSKLQSTAQKNSKYLDSLLRQSGRDKDSEATTPSVVLSNKMLNHLAAGSSFFIPRPYDHSKEGDVFGRQSTLTHWINELYLARSKDFRNMFDLMGKLRVKSNASKFFDYKSLAKSDDTAAQLKTSVVNACRSLKTPEDEIATLFRGDPPAPCLKANLPQYRNLVQQLVKNDFQQQAKLMEVPTQKRLYSTVLCANNTLASSSLYRSIEPSKIEQCSVQPKPFNECQSLDSKHFHPCPSSKALNADCEFEDLEKQAIEQYKPSDESINNKFTELERQALEQYDDGCIECASAAPEKGCEEVTFCSSKGCKMSVGDAETWEDFDRDLFECDRLKNRCVPPQVGGKKCAKAFGKRRIDSCICIDGKRGMEAKIGRGSKRPICLVASKLRSGSARSGGREEYAADEKALQNSCLISSSRKVARGDCGGKKRMYHQIASKMQVAVNGAGDLGADP